MTTPLNLCPGSGQPTRTNGSCDRCGAPNVQGEYKPTEIAENLKDYVGELRDGEFIPPTKFVVMGYYEAKEHEPFVTVKYIFVGSDEQLDAMEAAMREIQLPVLRQGRYLGFREEDRTTFGAALIWIFDKRVNGWWLQQNALIEHRVCTNAEFEAAYYAGLAALEVQREPIEAVKQSNMLHLKASPTAPALCGREDRARPVARKVKVQSKSAWDRGAAARKAWITIRANRAALAQAA